MTPSDLKAYLVEKKQATLIDLSRHFHSDPEAVRAAMQTWLRKGKAAESAAPACNQGCCKCDPATLTTYRWLG